MTTILMTLDGMEKLKAEIKRYKDIVRPKVIAAIAEGREHGDLKENSEYHSAREDQVHVESKIANLENLFSNVQVIDPKKLISDGVIRFSSLVTLINLSSGSEEKFRIVSDYEADIVNGLLSLKSPLGSVLLGKSLNDEVTVKTPSGIREYKIVNVTY